MFTFRNLTILFFILLFALNVAHFAGCRLEWFSGHFCSHTYIYIVLLFGLYLGISIIMSFFICSAFHHQATCKGITQEKLCALTFDDGPDRVHTPEILDILRREHLTATFFVIGEKLKGNESLIQVMDSEGHLIGNHSWSHSKWFDFFPSKRMKRELSDTATAISEIIGRAPLLFRPPFGVINPAISNTVNNYSFHMIGWNIRSFDTIFHNQQKTAARIISKLSPGSIILLHDNLAGSSQLLENLIAGLKRHGFRIVPVDQLTQIKAYA